MLKRLSLCALASLAVCACAPSSTDGDEAPANSPFGYELAYADGHAQTLAERR